MLLLTCFRLRVSDQIPPLREPVSVRLSGCCGRCCWRAWLVTKVHVSVEHQRRGILTSLASSMSSSRAGHVQQHRLRVCAGKQHRPAQCAKQSTGGATIPGGTRRTRHRKARSRALGKQTPSDPTERQPTQNSRHPRITDPPQPHTREQSWSRCRVFVVARGRHHLRLSLQEAISTASRDRKQTVMQLE